MAGNYNNQITWNIKQHIGILSTNDKNGWTREANIVSWNGRPDKFDIRAWSPDHTKMGKGMTFTEDETRALGLAITKLFRGE